MVSHFIVVVVIVSQLLGVHQGLIPIIVASATTVMAIMTLVTMIAFMTMIALTIITSSITFNISHCIVPHHFLFINLP